MNEIDIVAPPFHLAHSCSCMKKGNMWTCGWSIDFDNRLESQLSSTHGVVSNAVKAVLSSFDWCRPTQAMIDRSRRVGFEQLAKHLGSESFCESVGELAVDFDALFLGRKKTGSSDPGSRPLSKSSLDMT